MNLGNYMKIIDPILAPDVSIYVDYILPQDFIDGGCQSIVIGLYKGADGKLHPTCRKQFEAAAKSSLVIQAYIWDDIILDPIAQADWVVQTVKSEGFPVKWIWGDQEQWWTNWNLWYQMRNGTIKPDAVPRATPANISSHNQAFMARLNSQFPNSGVSTNNGFVASWSYPMNTWLPLYHSWVPCYGRQPNPAKAMTWAQLKANWLPDYNIPLAAGQLPELVEGHQFTGDSCILPGSYNYRNEPMALDVSGFKKSFIDALRNDATIPTIPIPTPLPIPQTAYRVINARVNVRARPDSSSQWIRYAVLNEVVKVMSISNGWAQLVDNTYVYAAYIQKV